MTDEIDINSKEYKEGFEKYRFVREGVEMVIDKSCKKGIPLHIVMYSLLDAVDEEFRDEEITKLVEKLKDNIWKDSRVENE